jgi:hypothetical protein
MVHLQLAEVSEQALFELVVVAQLVVAFEALETHLKFTIMYSGFSQAAYFSLCSRCNRSLHASCRQGLLEEFLGPFSVVAAARLVAAIEEYSEAVVEELVGLE